MRTLQFNKQKLQKLQSKVRNSWIITDCIALMFVEESQQPESQTPHTTTGSPAKRKRSYVLKDIRKRRRRSTSRMTSEQQSAPLGSNIPALRRLGKHELGVLLPAAIEFCGDLTSLCSDWTSQEKHDRRRLVGFDLQRSGDTITFSFKPVLPKQSYQKLYISCIEWKSDHVVTLGDFHELVDRFLEWPETRDEGTKRSYVSLVSKPSPVRLLEIPVGDLAALNLSEPHPRYDKTTKSLKALKWEDTASALKFVASRYVGASSAAWISLTLTRHRANGQNRPSLVSFMPLFLDDIDLMMETSLWRIVASRMNKRR
jgi:hypothetical protein